MPSGRCTRCAATAKTLAADAPRAGPAVRARLTGSARVRLANYLAPAALIAALLITRLVALGSDPYARLDWSAGLLTDEGFYVHNARNVALFGHARTDEFNNMLLSPILHYAQVAMFSLFGAGAIQARMISVVCSLLTLALLYAALRRAFDNRTALTAVAFLGLDHANLLFNRMALMDTPAALPAIAAFYLFIRAAGRQSNGGDTAVGEDRGTTIWFFMTGLLLGITAVTRMLCAYMLPAPFIAIWPLRNRKLVRGALGWIATGVIVVATLYTVLWYLPQRAEIAPLNAYYRAHQLQPRSFNHFLENVRHAFTGDYRGMSPYLFRHTPVLFGLALLGLACRALRRKGGESNGAAAEMYLTVWLLLGWAMLAVISYSPSRYYVTLYPALASVAAITVWRLPEAWETIMAPAGRSRLARGILTGFVAFHAALSVVHYGGVLPAALTAVMLYSLPAALGMAAAAWSPPRVINARTAAQTAAALIGAWAFVNGAWLADWARHIDYSQRDMSQWLAANLPANAVLIGDVAPGVSLDNAFRAIHVQPGLVNFIEPVERYVGSPRFVVILDGRWKERYWLDNYPELVTPMRRIKLAHINRWDVGVYAVDAPFTKDR